ncbi:MAG: hypothetical protein ACXQTS_03810 [Candidatus Methanospirareceae archaeon]
MKNIAKFKVWKKGREIGEFLYLRRLDLTLFKNPQGELEKPRLSFEELYKLYKEAGYEIKESFSPIDRLFMEGRVVLC